MSLSLQLYQWGHPGDAIANVHDGDEPTIRQFMIALAHFDYRQVNQKPNSAFKHNFESIRQFTPIVIQFFTPNALIFQYQMTWRSFIMLQDIKGMTSYTS